MSSEEKAWFEKEMEGNIALQEEISFHQKVDSVLSDKETFELKAQLDQIHDEINETAHKGRKLIKNLYKKTYLAAGTVVTIALFLTLYSSNRNFSNDKLIGLYYQPAETSVSYRSAANPDDMLSEAMNLYENKDYQKAIHLFESVLQVDNSKIGVNLYSGISYMEIEDYNLANQSFQTIIDQKPNPFVESATWYLGLCYLFTDEREKAKESFSILVETDSYYKDEAKNLLRRL